MNILVGKDVLKFFSKNKKGVSESQGFSSEEIAHGVFRVEKKTNYFHKKAICKDGKLYNTETAIKVIELDKEKVNWFGSYQMRTYFISPSYVKELCLQLTN